MEIPYIPKPTVVKPEDARRADQVRPSKAEPKVDKAGGSTDSISLSSRAKLLQQLRASYDKLPEVREDKIQDLKKRIQEGSYKLSSEEIVQHLLDGNLISKT